jgi:hypothetical protein
MTTRPQPESRTVSAAYRAASEALDERPDEATRSAILSAAARAVAAKPRAIGATSAQRWRIPLAAAATVLISTIAVIVAQRTQEQMPATIAETAPPAVPVQPEVAGAVTPTRAGEIAAASEAPVTAPAARQEAAGSRRAPSRSVPAAPPRATEFAARADAPPAAVAGPGVVTDAASPGPGQARGPQSSKVEAAAPIAPGAISSGKASSAEGQVALPAAPGPAARDALTPAFERSAPAAAGVAASPAAPMSKAETPERWLARVIELRQAGRDQDADAELKKLRELHPTLTIPETALRRAATR